MYRTILFPTDWSEGSKRTREYAFDLAADQDARVHVLHVVDVVAPGVSLHEMIAAHLAERAQTRLDAVADEARAKGVEVTTALRDGDPATEIVAYAEREGVDVIVMPTHGRTELEKTILGSVTDKVIRTGSVPVIVLKLEPSEFG